MWNWKTRAHLLGACLALAGSLALAGVAEATPTWLAATALSKEGASSDGAAMAEDGAAAVAWANEEGKTIFAATRAPFGSFEPAVALPAEGSEELHSPRVGIDGEGAATVVWLDGQLGEIEAATVRGGLASSHEVLSARESRFEDPVIAVDERGDSVVAWTAVTGASSSAVQAAYRPAGGRFGPAATLSTAESGAVGPAVAIDAAGEATVAWQADKRIESSHRVATGSFSAPVAVSSASEEAASPEVAANATGATAVVWSSGATGSKRNVELAARPASGAFTAARTIASEASEDPLAQVALDAAGEATVAWAASVRGVEAIDVAETASSGTLSAPVIVAYDAALPSLAVDADGAGVLGYVEEDLAGTASAGASYRPSGGSFGAQSRVSAAGEGVDTDDLNEHPPVIAGIDAEGDGLLAFSGAGEDGLQRAALLDAAGPALNDLSIPATGTIGEPVTFSVAPASQVSSVASTTWSFGDASSASGASVSHTFAELGTYSVSVTSIDANGNATTTTGKITISAAQVKGNDEVPKVRRAPTFRGARLVPGSTRANASGGFRLKVRCVASTDCNTGSVKLTAKVKVDGLPPATIKLGKDKFRAAAGARTYVTFTLNRALLTLLRKDHKLKLSATVEASDYRGESAVTEGRATLKPPKAKRRR